MLFAPAIFINFAMAFCALLVSFGGFSKWPRLTAMFGGLFTGMAISMTIFAVMS